MHKSNLDCGSCSQGYPITHSLAHTSPSFSETLQRWNQPALSAIGVDRYDSCLHFAFSVSLVEDFIQKAGGLSDLLIPFFPGFFWSRSSLQSLTTSYIRTWWPLWRSPLPSFGGRGQFFPPHPTPVPLYRTVFLSDHFLSPSTCTCSDCCYY